MRAQGIAVVLAAVAAGAAGCAVAPAKAGRVGSTIALLQDGRVAVLNPDQGSVSLLDPDTLAIDATISVGGHPRALLQRASGDLWVATYTGGQLAVIDPKAATVTQQAALCAGPAALAESPDQSWVAVTCEFSGTVLRIDPATLAATTLASGLRRPRGVAVAGTSVFVSELTGGDVVEIDSAGHTHSLSLVPAKASYRPALTEMTADLAAAVVPAFGYLFVPHELVDHTGQDTTEQQPGDYGTVLNGTPKINAAVTRVLLAGSSGSVPAETPPVYSRFDVPSHSCSGPIAAAPWGSHYLLVADQSSNDVAVLDVNATGANARLVGTFSVGAGPSGVAVDAAHSVAYVDNAFDVSVSKLDLSQPFGASAPAWTATTTLVRDLPSPYSEAALDGRRLFHDATNPHVTPARVVSCATCHPDGHDDGLVWFIQTPTIPLKRRRTPDLANSKTGTAPFHWDGEFATIPDLVQGTITGLMGGDALLVDGTTVQAYIDEIVQPIAGPAQDAAAVARGKMLFDTTSGCVVCHSGAQLTDNAFHAVLDPMSLSSDDIFTTANTPGLLGVFDRAPYFHDGRSPSLEDLLTRSDASAHGHTSQLTAAQRSDLISYLRSL